MCSPRCERGVQGGDGGVGVLDVKNGKQVPVGFGWQPLLLAAGPVAPISCNPLKWYKTNCVMKCVVRWSRPLPAHIEALDKTMGDGREAASAVTGKEDIFHFYLALFKIALRNMEGWKCDCNNEKSWRQLTDWETSCSLYRAVWNKS